MFELDVSLDDAKLRSIVTMLGNMPERTERAVRRGVRKAAKRLASETGRDTAQALAIVRASMRGRLRTYRKTGIAEKVWLGMNALAAHRLGRPIKTRTGVQVGQHFFDRAFIVRKWGGSAATRGCGLKRFAKGLSLISRGQPPRAAVD